MGSLKGKESLVEDRRDLKNANMKGIKIYVDDAKSKTHAPKSLDNNDKQMVARKPLTGFRKSVPCDVVMKRNVNGEKVKGKCDISVKGKDGRKALADVSNARSYVLRSRPSNGSKPIGVPIRRSITDSSASSRKPNMGETEVTDSQSRKELNTIASASNERVGASNDESLMSLDINNGKTASKPPMAARKSAASQRSWRVSSSGKSAAFARIWRGSSSGGSTAVITKGSRLKVGSIKSNVKFSENINVKSSKKIVEKPRISGIRTTRKALVEINNIRSYELRNRSSDGSRLMSQSGRSLSQSRVSSASQTVEVLNTSSRNPVMAWKEMSIAETSSKSIRAPKSEAAGLKKKSMDTTIRASKSKAAVLKKKSMDATADSSMEGKVVNGPIESAIPHECSIENGPLDTRLDTSGCSSKSVTAIISKPKRGRRRSYTSLLMARSTVLGEHAGFIKQDEITNIDDAANQLEVAEYVDDIYQYYWIMEAQNLSLANYMAIQTEINSRMRGILINWLIEVHLKFELMQETLFLMVELLDRFLSTVIIKKDDMQLVGLTALLLASKYEDFWHPKIKDLISISSDLYTRDQMLAMEKLILKKLMFRLNSPTPYVFMLRFLKAAQADRKLEHLAFYLVELCLVEYEALKYKPTLLCASAIYVARCTLEMVPAWTPLLIKHSHYEKSQLRSSADMLLRFQRAAGRGLLKVTYEKYLSTDRSCVAEIKPIDGLPL